MRIFELLGRASERSQWDDLVRAFTEALALFRARRWDEAAAAFASLLEKYPDDGPSRLYVKRSHAFAASPPPAEWIGVTVMETK